MSQRFFVLGLLAASALAVGACAGPIDGNADDAESQENDVKKKVKPSGGNGAFDLEAPAFDATEFRGAFSFANAKLAVGARSEKVPGTYTLRADPTNLPASAGVTMRQSVEVSLTAGNVASYRVGGLRVRYAEPTSLGGASLALTPEAGSSGSLTPRAPWQAAATGASILSLAGKVKVQSGAGPSFDVEISQGALTEVVLPVARVTVGLDAYDAAYPTPDCGATFIGGGAGSEGFERISVRKEDGSPMFTTLVTPQGAEAPLVLSMLSTQGVVIKQATEPGKTHTFTLNRLEIDDVSVAKTGGGIEMIPGRVTVARKNDAATSFTNLECVFPTRSGVDLPDGTYRVTTVATAASGRVTHVEEVTFP